MGLHVQRVGGDIDETRWPDEPVREYVQRLAHEKARVGRADARAAGLIVVAGDTVVALGEQIFGKPQDAADAQRMLSALSDRSHTVHTAVAVHDHRQCHVECVDSIVTFMPLTPAMIAAYWASGEPQDKAGAYGIQGRGGRFMAHLQGSFSAVMGLPVYETANLLTACGLDVCSVTTEAAL